MAICPNISNRKSHKWLVYTRTELGLGWCLGYDYIKQVISFLWYFGFIETFASLMDCFMYFCFVYLIYMSSVGKCE